MSIIELEKYLHIRSGNDPNKVKIDLMEKKINDINIRLDTVERFLIALQNPERREKDSIKNKLLFPDQLFALEFNQLVSLIDGLKNALSQESFDTLKNEFSEVLQIHEMFKAYIKDYRVANIKIFIWEFRIFFIFLISLKRRKLQS